VRLQSPTATFERNFFSEIAAYVMEIKTEVLKKKLKCFLKHILSPSFQTVA
jgi:hypothetical protein